MQPTTLHPERPSPERRRMRIALLLSLLFHALLLGLTFGGQGVGLPGFGFPWQERRAEVPNLRVVLAPLRVDANTPSAGDELILYQALLGSWPLSLDPHDDGALRPYAERLRQWQQKALREAKLRSSWSAPCARPDRARSRNDKGAHRPPLWVNRHPIQD